MAILFLKKLRFFLIGSTFIIATLILVNSPTLAQNDSRSRGQIRAAAAQGLVKINGQDAVVEVLVAIQPGENPQATARAVLLRAYPNARPINSAQFRTNGLFWDVFSDANPGNNFVTTNYNPRGVPGNLSNPRNVWLASQITWTDVTTSNFVYRDGGDTSRCPSLVSECPGSQYFDGYNDIGWLDLADPRALGVTWYGTSIDEFDMVLDNRNFSWYTGDPGGIPNNAYDTQTVWLHEFGHGLGLDHSNIEGAVMEPYYEGVRRVLHQDDIDGISFLYPAGASPTPTPTPAPTPTPLPSCNPGNEGVILYWDVNYGGSCVTFTTNDSNIGNSYPWFNDQASSMRILGDFEAILYENAEFLNQCGGPYTSNLSDLLGCSDKVSSIRVNRLVSPACNNPPEGVTLYWDVNYGGACITFTFDDPNLGDSHPDFNDKATSLRIVGNYNSTLYENAGYNNPCGTYQSDTADLLGCSDKVSSLRVWQPTPTPTPTPVPTPTPTPTPSPTPTSPPSVACWNGSNQYLYRSSSQAQKFCKCAEGTYGYKSYSYSWTKKTVYYYSDSSNNENWSVSSRSSYLPVSSVTCSDGVPYLTNQTYYYP